MNNWIGEAITRDVPAPEDDGPFDLSVAEHLRSLDEDGSFLLDLLEMFRSDSRTLLNNLQAALGAGDSKTVKGLAHQLKGSTGLLGLKALSAECAKVEHDFESIATAAQHFERVLVEYDRALAYVGDLASRTEAESAA